MSEKQNVEYQKGVRYALSAYTFWGLTPIYWKFLKHVPSLEILCHRIFWSFIFYTIIRAIKEKKCLPSLKNLNGGVALKLFAASLLVSGNWWLYIYAVTHGHVVDASLGYFINPLVNILFSVSLLNEKLQRPHKIAASIAFIGVGIITYDAYALPYIALTLAFSFGLYGVMRKKITLASLEAAQWESLFVIPATAIYFFLHPEDLATHSTQDWVLLILSGLVTGLPLLLFAEAVKRLPYYVMGFFQYIVPTLIFICGIFLFDEVLRPIKLVGFFFIWAAILFLLRSNKKTKA